MAIDILPFAFGLSLFSFFSSVAGIFLAVRRGRDGATAEDRRIAALRRQHEKAEARRLKTIKRVAKELRPKIIQALARYGFSYIYERQGAMTRMSTPVIRTILYTKDAIYFRIDRLPFRTTFTDLLKPEVEQNLSLAIGRECQFQHDVDIGVWLQVGLRSGVSAIPRFFPYTSKENPQNALELLPATKNWAVPIGMTTNRRFVYEDVRDFPHLLVAGATGGGKSVFMNQMLATMISRNTPKQLELILIDLKGGLEFWPYHNLPHLRRPVVIDAEEIPEVLGDIKKEKERRFALLRRAGVKDIRGWNHTKAAKLPYIFVFFDEIASLMLNPKLKRVVDGLINDLAAQGRALGLHLILCTQIPNRDVLSTIIRGNIPSRVCFNTDETGSMIVLGNHSAAQIPPHGRMIYRRASYQVECQAPFISEAEIDAAVNGQNLPQNAEKREVTINDLFTASLYGFAGKFTVRALYSAFEGDASETFIRRAAKEYEYSFEQQGPVIEIDGSRFVLGRVPMRGGRGRFLVPLADGEPLPTTQEEMEALAAPAVAAAENADDVLESVAWEEE
ncbi:MAG: hypothetical protein D6706_02100 [Chloroflexi bacterium]|nr:MAG: hypothetical protein D6706_02100 [Chloroflexota bacterium]